MSGPGPAGVTICLWEYTRKVVSSSPKKLPQLYWVVHGKVQLEHRSHIVKVGVEATCQHFKSWCILKEMTKVTSPFRTMPQEPWHPGKGAKPDGVIQLNCRKVHTHASYKTTRTRENFSNQGTKMILLSDNPWLLANKSKGFGNKIRNIRNNLCLCKHSEIYFV